MDPFADVELDDLRRRTGTKWTRYGPDVIPAWIADADLPVCPVIADAVLAAVARGDLTYPPDDAPDEVAAAFVERMSVRHGWSPDPAGVILVADLVQAFSLAVDHLSEPGEGVLLQTPCYPPFLEEIAALERRLVPSAWTRTDHGWDPDLDHMAEFAMSRRGGVLVLVKPHNPTGRVWRCDELTEVARIAEDADLVVISDEIHAELIHDDHVHVPFASMGTEAAARTITLTSASKSFNSPGLRCGVMHLGPGARLEPLRRVRPSQIGQINNLGMAGTLAAWRNGGAWLESFRLAMTGRRDAFAAMLDDLLPGVEWIPPEATYLAWLDCGALELGDDPAQWFLDHALVALSSGPTFGAGGRGYARLNLATSPGVLSEIVERMVTALDLR